MGPGGRRVFLNTALTESLANGATEHPIGAAAVREMTADDLTTPRGWSASVKFAQGAHGWLWFEVFGPTPTGRPTVASRDAPGCTGCHDQGRDRVRSVR